MAGKNLFRQSVSGSGEIVASCTAAQVVAEEVSSVKVSEFSFPNAVASLQFPEQPVRQWVLSVPFPLRFLFASRPDVMGGVLGIV